VQPPSTPAHDWARKVTDSTDDIAIGLALCLGAADREDGGRLFDELGDAALWSGAVTTALKYIAHVPRPDDPTSHDSFPSGHASLAFNVATVLTDEYPVLAPLWYGWAAGVAASRLMLGRHRVDEVAAGAVVGVATALWALHSQPSLVKHLTREWNFGTVRCRFGPQMGERGITLLQARW